METNLKSFFFYRAGPNPRSHRALAIKATNVQRQNLSLLDWIRSQTVDWTASLTLASQSNSNVAFSRSPSNPMALSGSPSQLRLLHKATNSLVVGWQNGSRRLDRLATHHVLRCARQSRERSHGMSTLSPLPNRHQEGSNPPRKILSLNVPSVPHQFLLGGHSVSTGRVQLDLHFDQFPALDTLSFLLGPVLPEYRWPPVQQSNANLDAMTQ
ncbi:hypothetical protein DAPPUDRAFT_117084 [Daphnia pulex]|uniref:Uncharacterized protein n=1 Tax=Daphnia pulex TaxID=6669 RepID=E9HRH1_DAPPU|nr:hypothetical protein DAPPUDRAFT_117084 [Daphnia pulex]|eukprot:EFX65643.1 hypothetical protein DAPPUDRAFT_117084 [Daphnia pulex]